MLQHSNPCELDSLPDPSIRELKRAKRRQDENRTARDANDKQESAGFVP